jgi:hypothetical protein
MPECPPHRTRLEKPFYDYVQGIIINKGTCVKCGEPRDTICPIIDIDNAMPTLKNTKKKKSMPDGFHEEGPDLDGFCEGAN